MSYGSVASVTGHHGAWRATETVGTKRHMSPPVLSIQKFEDYLLTRLLENVFAASLSIW